MNVTLREGRDTDRDGFIRLIGECWSEFPGCILDVDGEVPELRALASYFGDAGGALGGCLIVKPLLQGFQLR